jgi:putative hemolysin
MMPLADVSNAPLSSPVLAAFLVVVFIAMHALVIAGETAIENLKPHHIRFARESDDALADRLQALLDDRQRYAAACALAGQFLRLLLMVATLAMAQSLSLLMPIPADDGTNFVNLLLSVIAVALPVGLLNLIFGQLLPKSYGAHQPQLVANRFRPLILVLAFLFSVPSAMIVGLANLFAGRFGGRTSLSTNQAEEEIRTLMESARESGEIERDERELLSSVFEFTDTVAREVMTPRVDLDALPARSDPSEVVLLIQQSGHSRIPLFEETDDQIVGIVHAKDLLMAIAGEKRRPSLRKLMRAPLFVPENKNLHDLLTEMRTHRSQMAIVQDDFGGTAGIVTIEDIVEELVGEIVDEYDVEEAEITPMDGAWLIDGRTHLDDVNDEIGSEFESEEFDTLGGYVFGLFGRQPKVTESIRSDGYHFEIAQTDGRRIQKLLVRAAPEPDSESPGD